MIGKAKSNKSAIATIEYNEKENSVLLFAQKLKGENVEDFKTEFSDLHACYNGRSRNLVIHAQLSPGIEDGQNLTKADWQKIARVYLEKMNLSNHQAIGFLHQDKQHRHLHLVINRVSDRDFSLYDDSFISKKSEKMADEIAKELGLTRARVIMFQNLLNEFRRKESNESELKVNTEEQNLSGSKAQFQRAIEKALNSNVKNIDQFFSAIEKSGFIVHQYYNKETGLLRGYALEKNGTRMDASSINRKYSVGKLKFPYKDMFPTKKEDTKLNISKIESLIDSKKLNSLKSYLSDMGFDDKVLSHLLHKFVLIGKTPYVAFENDSKGHFLLSSYGIKSMGTNDITFIQNPKAKTVIVVEDVMDFVVACKELNQESISFIILNSLSNQENVIKKLNELQAIKKIVLLKNDSIGIKVAGEIISNCNGVVNCTLAQSKETSQKDSIHFKNRSVLRKKKGTHQKNVFNLNIPMAKGVVNNNDGLFDDFYEIKEKRNKSLGL